MEFGILSLSDLQTSLDTGQPISAAQRIADTIDYAVRTTIRLAVKGRDNCTGATSALSEPLRVTTLGSSRRVGADEFRAPWGSIRDERRDRRH
jgi:hypothetical protein